MQFDYDVNSANTHGVPTNEQEELLAIFTEMLRAPTKDGGNKRATGDKPNWKVDPDHVRGLFSHLGDWCSGKIVDKDSGAHPLVHVGWRALAIAWQETNKEFVPRWSAYDDYNPLD